MLKKVNDIAICVSYGYTNDIKNTEIIYKLNFFYIKKGLIQMRIYGHYKQYDYEQHKYSYNTEYPLQLFFKYKKKKKVLKKKETKKTVNQKLIMEPIIQNIDDKYYENSINMADNYVKKHNSTKKVEKLISNYYDNYKNSMFNNLDNKTNLFEENISSIKSKCEHICQFNSEIIYTYYDLYKYFLKYIKSQGTDSEIYKEFKFFIKKNNNIYIENVKLNILYKYMQISYELIDYINNNINKDKIINIFSMLCLNIDILYKLNNECLYELKKFIKEKYKKDNAYNTDNNFSTNNIEDKFNTKDINKICSNIPISYVGSKRKIANKIISSIFINDNINNYIELCGGSLCISYIIKTLYPHINITVYENDIFLLNFYFVLKNKYNDFILRLTNIIEELKNTTDKEKYLQNVIGLVNKNIKYINNNNFNNLELACYYYLINKISFRSTLNYNKENKINITINKKRINLLLNFSYKHKNKLQDYSAFLNSINLVGKDICKNYNEILNNLDDKTIIYVDPPYYGNKDNHRFYQNNFNKDQYTKLKDFLDNVFKVGCKWIKSNSLSGYIMELFGKYKTNLLNLNNDISNFKRTELLITSF